MNVKMKKITAIVITLTMLLGISGCGTDNSIETAYSASLSDGIPQYTGRPYVEIEDNVPDFSEDELSSQPFEHYGDMDSLGRCTEAVAMLSPELMPDEERESIGQIKPSGWHTVRYDDLISDKYLYNRCHLIGFQLAGENANEKNLITGTRYMNVEGMLPFENQVASYIEDTGNRVMYRVTPVFDGDDLVAKGVVMEAYSPEDDGRGVCFDVFVFNVQPGVVIDYATGESSRADENSSEKDKENSSQSVTQSDQLYILNISTGKFHLPECFSVSRMKEENREETKTSRQSLIDMGYEPCGICNP